MINKLPKDIILKFYDYLYLIDRLRLSECSKYMNEIFKEHKTDEIYEIKEQEDLKKIIKAHKNMKFHFDCNKLRIGYDNSFLQTDEIKNLYSLKINYIKEEIIDFIKDIKILEYINYTGSTLKLDIFTKLKKLRLRTSFTNINKNIFNKLKNLEYLDLAETNVNDMILEDLQNLNKLDVLIICGCDEIKKPPLLNIKHIDATKCENLEDVSGFRNVYDLNISFCNKITDIQPLINVYKINLFMCKNIKYIPRLNVKYLNIGYTSISHKLPLKDLEFLNVCGCHFDHDLNKNVAKYVVGRS